MAKILIVDDDDDVRTQFKGILEAEGFSVFEASEGVSALRVFNEMLPDAVVLDLNMPGMGGMEVFHELKKIDRRVPVIILTGFGNVPTTVEAVRSGVYDFIEKPPDFDKLVSILKHAVEKKLTMPDLPLTEKQIEVLKLTATGKSSSEIADILDLSEDTVNYHIGNARSKLSAANKAHAVAKAIQLGLIDPE